MKSLSTLFAVSMLATASVFAQEKPAPEKPELRPTPQPGGGALDLIPESPTPMEKPGGHALDEPGKKNKTSAAEEAIQQRIRYRVVKTKALREPAIVAEWDAAQKARTDSEKREALKRYYKKLFARIEKMDASLKPLCTQRQLSALHRLEQTRIDPTEPIDPDERADRFGRD